jgi:hypothetical protein
MPESERPTAMPAGKRWAATVTVVAIVFAMGVGAVLAQTSRAAMTQSAAAPAAPATDEVRTIPVEIAGESGGVYSAVVLVKDGAAYHRTGEKVMFKVPEGTPYIMGGVPDMKPGGTAQVRGKTENGVIVADRVVILTTSIKVE